MDVLFVLWVVLVIIFLLFVGYYFYSVREETNLVQTKSLQNTTQEEILFEKNNTEHPFVLDGNIKDDVIYYAASYYYSIPEYIRTEFNKDGWQVVLTDKDISKEYYNGPVKGRLAGLADSMEKKLYIHGKKSDIRRAMLHEFGHYWDYQYGNLSLSSTFKEIYTDEKDSFYEKWKTDNHATSNSQEYFAEALAQLLLYPEVLEKNCPNTYNYVLNLVPEGKK